MKVRVGDRIPSVQLTYMGSEGPQYISTDELFAGRKTIIFVVPGAFIPTHSPKHLLGFLKRADHIKDAGVDTLACIATNDIFVVDAWAKQYNVGDKILMLADGDAKFARAMGCTLDLRGQGFGVRSRRYVAIVDDGTLRAIDLDKPENFDLANFRTIMTLPDSSRFQITSDLNICRILNGMWQVSGAHGRIDTKQAIASMFDYVDAGFTTWDLADHYGPAEDLIGEFRRQLAANRGEDALSRIQALTKWVPRPGKMTRQTVEKNIDRSRSRMDVQTLDLLQFHWWDYRNTNYLDALKHMTDLQQEGKIKHLALTNFDTEHLKIILDNGINIVSNQVQFSLIDRRPLVEMAQFCQERGIHLLCYGTLAGGLLSDRYLNRPEPQGWDLETVSLRKYKNMVDAWGDWDLFQQLLSALAQIAQKHGVGIANVAIRYILEQPAVAGAIVGARLSISEHIQANAQVFDFSLDSEDRGRLDPILSQSRDLFHLIGDCGDEYRR
jgi:aryl-alcohol dehydrogenase-like predicted oxidoreductase/peroxiredoxin